SIRTGNTRFIDLDFFENKIFTQKRKRRALANRGEIENRTAKVLFVRQDGEGTGATALVTSGHVGRGQIVADRSSRWRPAFEFRDNVEPFRARLEYSQQCMRLRVCPNRQCTVAKISRSRIGSKSRYDFPFSINDFRENSGHDQLRFVSRISAS